MLLNYTSGFTEGTVGVGVDALDLVGIKLDSGKGRHGNPGSSKYAGTVFPTNEHGRAADEFASLGLTAKVRRSKSEGRLGTLQPKLPVVTYNDGRLSHPADFTPVCTTELGFTAKLKDEFAAHGVKAIALSVDPVDSHLRWIDDINQTQHTTVNFPILADADRKVSDLYDLIHPNANDTLTVCSLFVIDPHKKVRLIITYPASTGRNLHEILRLIDSLQLIENHKVATPANWQDGDEVVIVPSLQDEYEIKRRFPRGYRAVKPYLRLTPQPNR